MKRYKSPIYIQCMGEATNGADICGDSFEKVISKCTMH